jgi:uncharacterized protein with ParB-like and HNH nuclease domain
MSTPTTPEILRRDIDGKGRTLWELFDNRRYAIDTYQREYKWQTKQLVELVDDLCGKFQEHYEVGQERDAVAKYGHYFLGSIILSQKKGQSYIIDGQQRLTTLTLFFVYLHHRQRKLTEADRVDVSHLILSTKYGKKSYNIDVPERAPCLDALYSGKPYNPGAKDAEAVRNMVARYKEIEENFPPDINEQALPYFLDWLLNNVHVVEITAYSDDDAYTIFETMNDRGLSLAPLDMLKSFIIANITDEGERDRVNGIWKQTTNRLLELDKEEPADAVKAWLRSQYADSIREGKKDALPRDFDRLGTEFHRWVREEENRKRLGLAKSADYVRLVEQDFKFYTGQYELLIRASLKPVKGLEIVYANSWLEFTLQYPLLLAPLTLSDDEATRLRKLQIVAAYVDILIARRLWNYRSIAYSTVKTNIFKAMREIRGKSVGQLVTILRQRLDEEEETFDSNTTLRLHQMNRYSFKWLLARMTDYLEVRGGLDSHFDEYMAERGKNSYEVEHIWADHWEDHKEEFTHEADFDEYRNRIGGLLLLPKTFNASYGDLSYTDEDKPENGKLFHYLKQNLLAQSLNPSAYANHPPLKKLKQAGLPFVGHEDFKKADLETRQKLYLAIAKQVWNPDRLNEIAGIPVEQTKSKAAVKFPSNPYDNYLWKCLLEGGTADEIAAKVAEHFADDSYKARRNPKTALKWIPETIEDMKAAGLSPKLTA